VVLSLQGSAKALSRIKKMNYSVFTCLIDRNNGVLYVLSLKERVHDAKKVCQVAGSVPVSCLLQNLLSP
jgi:hypothetical protein